MRKPYKIKCEEERFYFKLKTAHYILFELFELFVDVLDEEEEELDETEIVKRLKTQFKIKQHEKKIEEEQNKIDKLMDGDEEDDVAEELNNFITTNINRTTKLKAKSYEYELEVKNNITTLIFKSDLQVIKCVENLIKVYNDYGKDKLGMDFFGKLKKEIMKQRDREKERLKNSK